MSKIWIEVPQERLQSLGRSSNAAAKEMLLAWAMELYRKDEVSSGAAAAIAGIPRVEFLTRLAEFGIPAFKYGPGELEAEVTMLEEYLARK